MGRGKPKLPSGTWITREMFRSPAYLALGGAAPQVLINILGKRWFEKVGVKGRKEMVCSNCDSLRFTYAEAEKLGISKPRFTRAIDLLLAKGFLTLNHHGGGYQGDATVYALSDKWRGWARGMVLERRPEDPVQRGYRKPKPIGKKDKRAAPTHETVP